SELLATDRIESAGPERFLQRPRAEIELAAVEHLGGTERAEVSGLARLARERAHRIAEPREHVDAKARHPSGRSVHQHFTALGREIVLLGELDRESGGIAGGA